MGKFLIRPYILFLVLMSLLILIGVNKSEYTLDIYIYDTYYVLLQKDILFGFAIISGLIGLVYWILLKLKFKLLTILNILHWIFTIIGILDLFYISWFLNPDILSRKAYYTNTSMPDSTMFYGFAFLVIGQLIFIFNIGLGLFNSKKNNSKRK
ncbi:hypothetical protein [uncultured Aquimarina sp.]|uniref:hypothetical protein n=1 Tax=uncultured Aquimarina sp. TaxID=575652 RepID=UPI0026328239|nr:hypothetical protein [uncultured Aquimarina sp.]